MTRRQKWELRAIRPLETSLSWTRTIRFLLRPESTILYNRDRLAREMCSLGLSTPWNTASSTTRKSHFGLIIRKKWNLEFAKVSYSVGQRVENLFAGPSTPWNINF
jgi:hypothetical protein